jgi:hypothetical protein
MQYRYLLLIITLLLIVTACGDKKEACLDIEAANFDVSADKNCCCIYPELIMNVAHQFDTLPFRLDSTYTYNEIDTFVVEQMSLLFSRIHPVKDGIAKLTEDTIHINIDDALGAEQLEVEDNFLLIQPNRFEYTIGTFAEPETYDGIELTFGLGGDLERVLPDSVHTDGHILASEDDSIWSEDKGYFYLYMEVLPVASEPDNKREIVLYGANHLLEWNLEQQLLADIGYDFEINIKIDYKILFDGIDFVGDDTETIALKIKQNLISSISFDEI